MQELQIRGDRSPARAGPLLHADPPRDYLIPSPPAGAGGRGGRGGGGG
jgi:hypothetical protein